MIVGSYGIHYFEVSSSHADVVNDITRKASARLEEHQVTGGKPLLEFLGPQLREISMSIRFIAALIHGSPLANVNQWREMSERGEVHRLILGCQYLGNYILTEVGERWNKTNALGIPIDIEMDVTFKEYV